MACYPMGGVTSQENPLRLQPPVREGKRSSRHILPYMEQQSIYNAVNFNFSAGGVMEYGFPHGGATNRTALITQINSYICPSDFQQIPLAISVSENGYAQAPMVAWPER